MTENAPETPLNLTPPRPDRVYDHEPWVLLKLAGDERYEMLTESVTGEEDGDSYTLNREGVWRHYVTRERMQRQLIAALPLIMSRRFVDDRGGVRFELAWLSDEGDVNKTTVTAETLNDAGKLFRVIPDNAITSTMAKSCVEYLSHLRRHNRDWLVGSTERVMTALGWDVEGIAVFTAGEGRPHRIHDSRNTGKWLRAFKQKGTLTGWIHGVHAVSDRVPVQVMITASLAAPMLRVLNSDNFAIDMHGGSSTGKTGGARGGMSCWAEPVAVTVPWSDTETSMNHKLAMLRGMPILLDETQLAREDPKKIEHIVYGLTQGKSKGRSTGDGKEMQDVVDYESIAIITGEDSVLTLTKMPGISARVVPITGAPFESKKQSDEFKKVVNNNHGHAGPAFVEHLQLQDEVELRSRYDDMRKALSDAVEGEIPGRRADSVAVLQLTNELAHEAGLTPLLSQETWVTLTEGGEIGLSGGNDRPREALGKILDWAVLNRSKFYERGQAFEDGFPARNEWLGRWEAVPAANSKYKTPFVGFNREKLVAKLQELGYQGEATISAWASRGWLLITMKKGAQHKTTIANSSTNVVAVTEVGDLFTAMEDDVVVQPESDATSIAQEQWVRTLSDDV